MINIGKLRQSLSQAEQNVKGHTSTPKRFSNLIKMATEI